MTNSSIIPAKPLARLLVLLFLLVAGEAAAQHRELAWEELVPDSWQPEKLFANLNLENITDNSPEAAKALKIIADEWKNAPANPALKGQSVKLPGYVVPLDWESSARLKEFLLVPYFGACIHLPPPPANQIIYVRLGKPAKGIKSMDAVWVYGKLELERNDSGEMGSSSYSMRADKVELYK
ncbi:MAG: DUF3299 domain-containing protein [Betaproteobacteria bacterium]|nr:DUF3299 domain-containing protein [Betaproteobacteria bacterium]